MVAGGQADDRLVDELLFESDQQPAVQQGLITVCVNSSR